MSSENDNVTSNLKVNIQMQSTRKSISTLSPVIFGNCKQQCGEDLKKKTLPLKTLALNRRNKFSSFFPIFITMLV